jgi:uncharacterized protein YggU (UPF0235/DUF167 family)
MSSQLTEPQIRLQPKSEEQKAKSMDKDAFAYDVERLITEIKVVKRDLNLLNSAHRDTFLKDLTEVITKYQDICQTARSNFRGGNKSRCKKLKIKSKKTNKVKRFCSGRNKK